MTPTTVLLCDDALFMRNGFAWLDGTSFQDGIVEFDVAAPAVAGFHGIAFRAQDDENHEHVYIRPHLSGQSDAVQYQPVFNDNSAWQIYTGAQRRDYKDIAKRK